MKRIIPILILALFPIQLHPKKKPRKLALSEKISKEAEDICCKLAENKLVPTKDVYRMTMVILVGLTLSGLLNLAGKNGFGISLVDSFLDTFRNPQVRS